MKFVISGASGLIGKALSAHLTSGGHEVLHLVRRQVRADHEVSWDPAAGTIDVSGLHGIDVAINLSGAGVGDKRWTAAYKKVIHDSRIQSAKTFVNGLLRLPTPPASYLQASAIGFYGDRDDELLTEASAPGRGFLADVCTEWEAQAHHAASAGIAVTTLRTGLVMAPGAGAFGSMLPLFKSGLGGPLSDGSAWWSWITLPDHVRACEFIATHQLTGAINMVAPHPARNQEVTKALGKALRRPAVFPVPQLALRAALGEFSGDVLASIRVSPTVLLDAGFEFDHARLQDACRWLAESSAQR